MPMNSRDLIGANIMERTPHSFYNSESFVITPKVDTDDLFRHNAFNRDRRRFLGHTVPLFFLSHQFFVVVLMFLERHSGILLICLFQTVSFVRWMKWDSG
jgi:hypothetical protein